MFKYFTLDDFDFNGKIVGVRVDINSPIINGNITLNERIIAHSETIKELSEKGAKVIILAHQGRKGKPDFISLKEHSKLLSKYLKKPVDFSNEVYSKEVEKKIYSMNNSDILVLENLRFFDDETNLKKNGNLILKLENLFDFYVFDAFSVAHREQTSVVGFKRIINVAGRVMQKEISGLNSIEDTKSPHVFVFGGAKPDDLVDLLEVGFNKKLVDLVILTGVIGEIALYIKGFDIGCKFDFLKEKGYLNSLDRIKKILEKYENKIIIPKDVALEVNGKRKELLVEDLSKNTKIISKNMIQDIGSKTIDFINLALKNSGSIYFKGPAGNFELKNFQKGSIGVLKAVVSSGAFTFMGGGHSVTAASEFKVLNKFSYFSLAGGALVKFLSGKTLPGIVSLENSFRIYDKKHEDFIVVGSNVVDTEINLPTQFNKVNLGDKVEILEDFKHTIGGGGINVSVALSRLGAKVGYLGKLSYQTFDGIKHVLDKNKINIIKSRLSKKSGAKSIILDTDDGDRVIFTYRGQNSDLDLKDFDISDYKSNNFYFNSLSGKSFQTIVKLVKKIKLENKNSKICFNPSSSLITNEKSLKQFLKYTDILILNYEEAKLLTKKDSVSNCLNSLKSIISSIGIVVITDGANGAYLFDGNLEYFQKAVSLKKIIDTTGAGDSYASTFFYFYVKGFGIKKSLKLAAKNSANVVLYKGAQPGLMYYEDLLK